MSAAYTMDEFLRDVAHGLALFPERRLGQEIVNQLSVYDRDTYNYMLYRFPYADPYYQDANAPLFLDLLEHLLAAHRLYA